MHSQSNISLSMYHYSLFISYVSFCSFHQICISMYRSQYSSRFLETPIPWIKPKHCTHSPKRQPIKEWTQDGVEHKGTMYRVSFETELQLKLMQSCCTALILN